MGTVRMCVCLPLYTDRKHVYTVGKITINLMLGIDGV